MTVALQRQGFRKPAQLEMIGGKCARQRIWEEIRKYKSEFQILPIAQYANADPETVKTYVQCLIAGEYVEAITRGHLMKAVYQLNKDTGIESPRLTRKGQPVQQGRIIEAMWRTLRILGEMDARQLRDYVAASGLNVTLNYAKRYIGALRKAGYLQVIQAGSRSRMDVIRLFPHMNTGPRAPQVQNVKTVYDPNLNKVMHTEDPQEQL